MKYGGVVKGPEGNTAAHTGTGEVNPQDGSVSHSGATTTSTGQSSSHSSEKDYDKESSSVAVTKTVNGKTVTTTRGDRARPRKPPQH